MLPQPRNSALQPTYRFFAKRRNLFYNKNSELYSNNFPIYLYIIMCFVFLGRNLMFFCYFRLFFVSISIFGIINRDNNVTGRIYFISIKNKKNTYCCYRIYFGTYVNLVFCKYKYQAEIQHQQPPAAVQGPTYWWLYRAAERGTSGQSVLCQGLLHQTLEPTMLQ